MELNSSQLWAWKPWRDLQYEGLKGTTRAFDEGNTKFSLYIMCVLDKHCKEGKIPYLYSLFILLQCPPPFKEG